MLDAGGQGVEAVAGVPLAVVFAWLLTIAGAAGTVLVARRVRRAGGSGIGLVLAGSAWLVLAVYWLV
jgi:hypothetical protein